MELAEEDSRTWWVILWPLWVTLIGLMLTGILIFACILFVVNRLKNLYISSKIHIPAFLDLNQIEEKGKKIAPKFITFMGSVNDRLREWVHGKTEEKRETEDGKEKKEH